jgi:hypothetical protein
MRLESTVDLDRTVLPIMSSRHTFRPSPLYSMRGKQVSPTPLSPLAVTEPKSSSWPSPMFRVFHLCLMLQKRLRLYEASFRRTPSLTWKRTRLRKASCSLSLLDCQRLPSSIWHAMRHSAKTTPCRVALTSWMADSLSANSCESTTRRHSWRI